MLVYISMLIILDLVSMFLILEQSGEKRKVKLIKKRKVKLSLYKLNWVYLSTFL